MEDDMITYRLDGATRQHRALLRRAGWAWSPACQSWTRSTLDGDDGHYRGCRLASVTDGRLPVTEWASRTYVAPTLSGASRGEGRDPLDDERGEWMSR